MPGRKPKQAVPKRKLPDATAELRKTLSKRTKAVRVAVEIDGFFHFQDLEAYRRDRRKDVLLQRGGYFVVRCLADDVVSRLEEIMHTIVTAVRQRHAQSMPS